MPVVFRTPSLHDSDRGSRPLMNDRACGHGVDNGIITVPSRQPLKHDGIWRVVLHGEAVVRVVRHSKQQGSTLCWQLLQINDLTDEQLGLYEFALFSPDALNQLDDHNQLT